MRLIFLNRFYWPEEPATAQLLTDLAEGLAAKDHEVVVIASRPGSTSAAAEETRSGVRIIRVNGTRWGQQHLLGRIIDFITFLGGAAWALSRTVRKDDVVVAMTDPPVLGVVVSWVAFVKQFRLWHWIQDIHPEVAVSVSPGIAIRLASVILRPLRNRSWQKAERCVTVSHDMAGTVGRQGIPRDRIVVIPNWAPTGVEPIESGSSETLRDKWSLNGKFVVAYAGNLGRVHDLDPVVEIATQLRDDLGIAFVFIGGGAQRQSLQQKISDRGLVNVHLYHAQPRSRLSETLAVGDVHLVTLREGCEAFVFPSKLYGVAAAGRPIFVIGHRGSELAQLVERRQMGFAFHRGQTTEAAASIRALATDLDRARSLGAAAIAFSASEGKVDHALTQWQRLLQPEVAC